MIVRWVIARAALSICHCGDLKGLGINRTVAKQHSPQLWTFWPIKSTQMSLKRNTSEILLVCMVVYMVTSRSSVALTLQQNVKHCETETVRVFTSSFPLKPRLHDLLMTHSLRQFAYLWKRAQMFFTRQQKNKNSEE